MPKTRKSRTAMDQSNEKQVDTSKESNNQTAATDFVTQGAKLIKVRSKYSKNERHFWVDPSEFFLSYKGSQKQKYSKAGKRIYLSDIQEVRSGSQSDAFSVAFGKGHRLPPDSHCFSLVFGEKGDMLDLVAQNEEERDLWVRGITEFCRQSKFHLTNPAEVQQLWAKKLFYEADRDKNGKLSLKEIRRLLNRMSLDVTEADISKDVKKRELSSDDFLNFLTRILQKPEIVDAIFKKYDKERMLWTKHELQQFLAEEQKENLSLEQCEKIIDEMETCPEFKRNHWLGLTGFMGFLDSEQMNIKDPKTNKVYQDMTQPLSHYFVASSHNTYLESDQLKGNSKVECYIKALKSGCRCVEMDVWDGDHSQPVIYHGFTLTSKLLFSDVIEVIDKYAFCKSKYPLILSIENHCSVDQQRVMAKIMKDVFKEKLFLDSALPGSDFLPSPSQLMERIVVKCKKLPESVQHERKLSMAALEVSLCMLGGVPVSPSADDSDDEPDPIEEQYEIALEFSELINICQTAAFKSFAHSKENHDFTFILSFSETKAAKLAKNSLEHFIQHNKRQLSRIYPAGSRIGSTNYDPVAFWMAGCQVVALNYQTPDEAMQLNRGLFEDNGGCGYVLKPDFMREFTSETRISPAGLGPSNNWHRTVTFKILSGFCLPKKEGDGTKSILDPFVQISMVGVPQDKKTVKTKVINNNGFHPIWNEEFQFSVSCPQLALLHLEVYDYETTQSDVVIAQFCLPVRCIQEGYRTVQLKTVGGEKLESAKLYVLVKISQNPLTN